MANTIKIKSGSGTPTTSDIQDKELAFDRSADRLYINDAGTIVDLTGSGATGDIEGVTAGTGLSGGGTSGTVNLDIDLTEVGFGGGANRLITDDGDGTVSTEANLTFNGNKLNIESSENVVLEIDSTNTYTFLDLYNDNTNRVQIGNARDGDFIIRTNDAERFTIDKSTGNIGMGTNNPTYDLDVAGDIGMNAVLYHNDDDNTYLKFDTDRVRMAAGGETLLDLYEDGTQDYVKLGDGGDVDINLNDDMFVEGSSGNVGIGENSPEAKLHIKNASAGTFTASNSQLLIENNTTVRLSMVTPTNNASKIEFGDVDDQDAGILEYNNSDNSMRFTTNTSEAMRIDSSGNVLIGRTSAFSSASLEIQNDATEQLTLNNTSTDGKMLSLYNSGTIVGGLGNDVAELVIYQGTTEAIRIDSSQNVGIGVSSPSTKMHIKDASNNVDLRIETDKVNGNAQVQYLNDARQYNAGINNVDAWGVYDATAAETRFTINSSGSVGIGTTSPTAKLDVRGNVSFFSSDASDFVSFTHSDNGIIINSAGSTSNKMFLRTGGSDALTIDASQNVGIGTSSPVGVLNVIVPTYSSRDTDAQHTIIANSGDAGKGLRIGYDNSGHKAYVNVLDPGVAWGDLILQESTGAGIARVGIGTASPSKKFVVKGASGDIARFEHNGAVGAVDIYSGTDGGLINVRNASGTSIIELDGRSGNLELPYGRITDAGTDMNIVSDNALTLGTESGTALTIPNASTNVGIGTQSPSSPLDIKHFSNTTASSTGTTLLTLTHAVGTTSSGGDLNQQKTFVDFTLLDSNSNETPQVRIGAEVGQNGDANSQEKEGSGAFVVYTNNAESTSGDAGASLAERMRVDYQGNVGIGVTSPSFSYGSLGLEIQSTGDTSLRLERDGSTAFEMSARSSDILIYNVGTARNIRFGIAGTEEFRMDTSGNFHADADVIAFSTTTASDIKFKENVKSIPYGLKEVLQMNPVEFDWIEKRDGTHDIGFIAQEMEKIVPEVIKETETLEVGGTHKTMDYAKLTSILVQAIQEQQQQINELKEKLNG